MALLIIIAGGSIRINDAGESCPVHPARGFLLRFHRTPPQLVGVEDAPRLPCVAVLALALPPHAPLLVAFEDAEPEHLRDACGAGTKWRGGVAIR